MENELKPCPFCGGEVTNYHISHDSLSARKYYFRCKKCSAYFILHHNAPYKSAEDTDREAIEFWNRRVDND